MHSSTLSPECLSVSSNFHLFILSPVCQRVDRGTKLSLCNFQLLQKRGFDEERWPGVVLASHIGRATKSGCSRSKSANSSMNLSPPVYPCSPAFLRSYATRSLFSRADEIAPTPSRSPVGPTAPTTRDNGPALGFELKTPCSCCSCAADR